MNLFEKLIRDGFVEVDASALHNFERAIECCTMLKVNTVCAKTEANLILVGKYDERDRVEIISGNTYYYDPIKWVLSKSVVDDDINKGWHDDIKLDERSKEILDSIWPVIHSRVMKMIDCGQ